MYKHCNTEEGARRQRQLEQCLLELMHTQPYSHITIGGICDQAGISRKSFYRYFGSKDGCLYALLDQAIMDSAAFCIPDLSARQPLHQIAEQFFTYWKQHPALLDALYKNNLCNCLTERVMVYLTEEEHNFQAQLEATGAGSYEQTLFVVTGVMGLLMNWHLTGYKKSVSQMAGVLDTLGMNS